MEAEYVRSVKQGILDYVLLAPSEQQRLGLHMPEPVRMLRLHSRQVYSYKFAPFSSIQYKFVGFNFP